MRLSRNEKTQSVFVFVGFLVLYLSTLSHNLAASHDSIGYINVIDSGIWLFHPHHLLYHPLNMLWVGAFRMMGSTIDSSLLVASLNSIFGAATLGIIFYILRRFFQSATLPAVSTTILIGCSYGFWFYSVCVEVYIIPLFFLAVGLLILFKRPLQTKDIVSLGIIHGVAVLFHQAFFLIGFAVLARLFFTPKDFARSKISAASIYGATAAIVVIAGYLPVIVWNVRAASASDALSWFTLYAHEAGMSESWNAPSIHSILKAAIGSSHSFIGGQFAFALPGFTQWFSRALPGHILSDELFLVRNISSFGAIVLCVFSVFIAATVGIIVVWSFRYLKTLFIKEQPLLVPLICWLVVFSMFFFIWDPSNLEFWIPQSMLLWLLLDRMIAIREKNNRSVRLSFFRILLPLLIIVINFFGSIRFLHSESNDLFYQQAADLAKKVTSRDLVLTDQEWITEEYYKRFTDAVVYSPANMIHGSVIVDSVVNSFQDHVRATLQTGGSIVSSFAIDSIHFSNSYPKAFLTIWKTAVDSIPLTEYTQNLQQRSYWAYRRK